MTHLAAPASHHHRGTSALVPLPEPRVGGGAITIRPAVMEGADVYFIDQLQKLHAQMVGFLPLSQIEKRIKGEQNGKVLIAQDPATTERIGYIIFADKYFRREDLGICYQLNIVPHMQRGLVGAALVKAAFEACPWGVKLFCCWCAQDLAANRFWESIGFVPIAFRAGSRGKQHGGKRKDGRMQIFWQRRIRENDEATPYWYPTETSGGAMKENRIVLPIQPGKHWSDELPFVLPGGEQRSEISDQRSAKALEGEASKPKRERKAKAPTVAAPAPARPRRGLWFATPAPAEPVPNTIEAEAKPAPPAAKPKRERHRNDPKLVAAAREFRDRYLDEVNSGRVLLGADGGGKYDVSRQLGFTTENTENTEKTVGFKRLLDAA